LIKERSFIISTHFRTLSCKIHQRKHDIKHKNKTKSKLCYLS
jgi:hypothetical protein